MHGFSVQGLSLGFVGLGLAFTHRAHLNDKVYTRDVERMSSRGIGSALVYLGV